MKKKEAGKPAEKPKKPFQVGDYVLTPISERVGEIIKFEERPRDYGYIYLHGMDTTVKEYTVKVPLPCLKRSNFIDATIVLSESDLTRPAARTRDRVDQ